MEVECHWLHLLDRTLNYSAPCAFSQSRDVTQKGWSTKWEISSDQSEAFDYLTIILFLLFRSNLFSLFLKDRFIFFWKTISWCRNVISYKFNLIILKFYPFKTKDEFCILKIKELGAKWITPNYVYHKAPFS